MKTYKYFLYVFLLFAVLYLLLPNPSFPAPPPGSLQSAEPSDTESIYRRAYFTNLNRDEVMSYYIQTFNRSCLQLRLNHPPEEAYPLIRDQTRSSFLEELVHPFRESLFINGFTPTKPTDQINRNGIHYSSKVTVKLVPSSLPQRLTVLSLTVWVVYLLIRHVSQTS